MSATHEPCTLSRYAITRQRFAAASCARPPRTPSVEKPRMPPGKPHVLRSFCKLPVDGNRQPPNMLILVRPKAPSYTTSTPTLQRHVPPAGWAEANSPCEGGRRSGGFGGTVLALPGLYRGRGCSGRLERRERGAKGAVLRPMIAIVHSGRHHFYS